MNPTDQELQRIAEELAIVLNITWRDNRHEINSIIDALLKVKDAQEEKLKTAREALETLSLYVAANGDDWVKRHAKEALEKIGGGE